MYGKKQNTDVTKESNGPIKNKVTRSAQLTAHGGTDAITKEFAASSIFHFKGFYTYLNSLALPEQCKLRNAEIVWVVGKHLNVEKEQLWSQRSQLTPPWGLSRRHRFATAGTP